MYLPSINEIPQERDFVDVFGGYNHNLRIGENEFYDEENLTSDFYPLMANRSTRGTFALKRVPAGESTARPDDYHCIQAMLSKDDLWCIDYGYLVKEGVDGYGKVFTSSDFPLLPSGSYPMQYDDGAPGVAHTYFKTIISTGAYIVIFPDGIYLNTSDYSDYGMINVNNTLKNKTITFTQCGFDGAEYGTITTGSTVPSNPSNSDYWIDTSSTPSVLKVYSASASMWMTVQTTYIKISGEGIGAKFNEGDGVKLNIDGVDLTGSGIEDINGKTVIIQAKGDDYIVVIGVLNSAEYTYTLAGDSQSISVSRKAPLMDYICESGNRLWGCRYGENNDGEFVNEIYASKLGDFRNWNCFPGISTDSYYASCGSDGKFTGAVSYLGNPLFFKEGCIHRVFGNYPSNYQVQSLVCAGCEEGSDKSIASINDTIYYKSKLGIMAYNGAFPVLMSDVFGQDVYSEFSDVSGASTSFKSKYYICLTNNNRSLMDAVLFVYDSVKGTWHKETLVYDNRTRATNIMLPHKDELFASIPGWTSDNNASLHHSDIVQTFVSTDNGVRGERLVSWYAETGDMMLSSPDKKYISRIDIRLSMELGSRMRISFEYDSSGVWENVWQMTAVNLRTFSIPIKPKRCDHLRMRIEGEGNFKIYSISKTYEIGSDL